MTRTIINGLLLSNAITLGALGYLYKESVQASSLVTTDIERETYGQECVDWMLENAKKAGHENAALKLARSWRKHGQMVFEVVADWDQDEFKVEDSLCVIDLQSGMFFTYGGISKKPWLFYE